MDLEIARGSVQLFNTIVHFPAKIVIQAGVLETWAIVTVNMKSPTPFALVRHNAHTPAGPVFARRSPRGFLTQPLGQFVSGYWPLPHWEQAVHIAWRGALFKQIASQEIVCRSLKVTFVEESLMEKRQITFHFEQRQCAMSLPLSLIAHSHVTNISTGVDCVMTIELKKSLKTRPNSGSLLLSRSSLRTMARFCCSL